MSEEEAHERFMALRWPESCGRPICPREDCGYDVVYETRRICPSRSKQPGRAPVVRRLWKCKRCLRQFSVTTATIFASRKLAFKRILWLLALFSNQAKNVSAIALSQRARCQYKTAFVFAHKVREALTASQRAVLPFAGEVEIDATYTGGHHRVANLVRNRKDRRRRDRKKQKCITIVRQRGHGGRSFAVVSETDRGALEFIRDHLTASRIYTDEAPTYNSLSLYFDVRRIDHTNEGYAVQDRSTNWAESYFSRFKRVVKGTHHHIAGPYTEGYANEVCWREDHRRTRANEQHDLMLGSALAHPVSRQWKGYWQRRQAA